MKKVTLLIILFVVSMGYSQTLLQGFEAGGINGAPFGGMPAPVIEAGTGSNTSQVLKIVTDTGQQPWQGINLFLSPSTDLTVNKTLTIDVLSDEEITFLVKVTTGGAIAAAPVTHNGDGTWQTLSFTFNTALDGQAANPSGTYSGFVIHPYWEVGRTQFFTPTVVPKPPRTFYVDNIREPAPLVEDVIGDVYINDGSFAAGDFTTAAGQDIATNDGSAAEPFATLDYALARSIQGPGDVIYIDAGTYSWPTTHALTDSGTLANPITIQGKGNNETNITTTAASTTSAGLHFTTGNHWVVKDLNWTAAAARAVWVADVEGITLENCDINMTSASAALQSIIIGTAGGELTIKNSTLTRSNTAFHMIEVVEGTTLIMQDNTVSFSALVGSGTSSSVQLRTNASSLIIIERNRFVNGGYGIGNVAGTAGPINSSSIIKNNFFNSFWGIVTTIVQGLTVHNNSFYTNGESIYGINAGSLTNWDIRNNILYTYGSSRTCVLSGSTTSHPAVMDYNHYYSPNTGAARQGPPSPTPPILSFTAWQNAPGGPREANGQGGNAASFDPLYVDAANGDLRLQPGSPAIDAGVDVGITDDIDGDARPSSGSFDMGADEFNAASCITVLGATSTTCDSFGSGATDDTYTATVDFSNGLDGNDYVITASSGTVGGDDPNLVASGTITVTGITEGTDVTITVDNTVDGGLCSLSTGVIASPSCIPPLEDFEGTTEVTAANGLGGFNVTEDPLVPGNTVLEIISADSGQSWQQANVLMQDFFMDVNATAGYTVEVDVYSTQDFTMLARLDDLIGPGPAASPSATSQDFVSGSGWQTLTFSFDQPEDLPAIANGQYSQIAFLPNWNPAGGWFPPGNFTVYVDNIRAAQGDPIPEVPVFYVYNNGVWAPSDPTGGNSGPIDDINIINGEVTISADLECEDLTIQPGAGMTIDNGVTVTTSTTTCFSQSALFSSLIVNGTISGTVNYHRFTNIVGINDLASPPLSGQTFGSFANDPGNGNLAFQGTVRAYAPYNTVAGEYQNYDVVANAGTVLESGVGYRAATIDGNRLIYSGTPLSTDVLDVPVTDAVAGKAWNLIGNPYPSYLDFDTFFNANLSAFESDGAFLAIYGYDGSASNGWTVWNLATIADNTVTELIAPGQGFFVKSAVGGGLVDYTTAMRRTGTSDDFIQGFTASDLDVALSVLNLSSATNNASTSIYFIEGTTRGLDPGYDAGSYQGAAGEFSIFTNLVEENEGLDMQIQALPYNDFNDVVVPLGVKAAANNQITISISDASYLPTNVNVYLEDTELSTLTLLNIENYVFTPTTDLIGTGRFFIRYSAETLSTFNPESLDNMLIYADAVNDNIVIKGQLIGKSKATLYDIHGRIILSQDLDVSNTIHTISVDSVSTGIYIVELTDGNTTKTQKLILK